MKSIICDLQSITNQDSKKIVNSPHSHSHLPPSPPDTRTHTTHSPHHQISLPLPSQHESNTSDLHHRNSILELLLSSPDNRDLFVGSKYSPNCQVKKNWFRAPEGSVYCAFCKRTRRTEGFDTEKGRQWQEGL